MLDTARIFETPEGVELQLHIAGPVVRALAWTLDALIRTGIYIALSIALTPFGRMGMGVLMVCIFLVEWFYPVIFEVLKNGATPGKKAMGIRVVQDNATPVSWSSSIIRNLLRVADFAPFLYGFGLISMLLNSDSKRLGDMAAGTLVVYAPEAMREFALPEQEALSPPVALSVVEQRAILDFSERSQLISKERQEELADILSDLTGEQGESGVKKLQQYANWLHGTQNR